MNLTNTHTCQQIIGSLIHNPLLLAEYDIVPNDFGTCKTAAITFISINNLFKLGAKTLSVMEIDQDVRRYEATCTIYDANGGLEFLQLCDRTAEEGNFKYHYQHLKKLSLLRRLKKENYDISDFYKESFQTMAEENLAIQLLDETPIDGILDKVEGRLSVIKNEFLNGTKESGSAASGIVDLVESLLQHPEIGVAMHGDYLNTACSGARLGKYYIFSASSGCGKAIPNYTMIPTPNGLRRVGDIKSGDYLFGRDGKPTKVLAIHPQKEDKEIWEVTFKDGRKAECCSEHLWCYKTAGSSKLNVASTKEIYDYANSYGGFQERDGEYRIKIPVNGAVEFPEKEYFLPPYVMGAFLGDGSFRYTHDQKSLSFSSGNDELPNKIATILGLVTKKNSKYNYNYLFKANLNDKHNYWVEEFLKDYPELWNVKSEDKFIPEDYLRGSVEQRYELLRGLMDTDGAIDKDKGRVSFCTISEKMKNDFVNLCRGLGFITTVHEDRRENKYPSTGVCYSVSIQASKEEKVKMFSLERKKNIAIEKANDGRRAESRDFLPIVGINPTGKFTSMTCFTVDNDDHMFLMNDYISTHNTRLAVYNICKICVPIHWDFKIGQFVAETEKTGKIRGSKKGLILTTELEKSEIQTILLSYISGVNESRILKGDYEYGELTRVRTAARILENMKDSLFVEAVPDPNLTNVSAIIRKYATVEKVQYVAYDYIFSSPSLINSFAGSRLREDVCLLMLSTQLKDLANEYNIFIQTSTQVNNEGMDCEGFKNETAIRGAKSIVDKADVGVVIVPIDDKEINRMFAAFKTCGIAPPKVLPTHRFDIYKNRRGQYKNVSVWSYIDLGTGRKEDLFITTASGKIIKDFSIIKDQTYDEVVWNDME